LADSPAKALADQSALPSRRAMLDAIAGCIDVPKRTALTNVLLGAYMRLTCI
jgi:hypothetical protein